MQKKLRPLFLLCAFFLCACGNNQVEKENVIPPDILKQEQMVALLKDLQMAEAAISLRNQDTTNARSLAPGVYKFVFEKHKITPAQFENNMSFYTSHPVLMHKVYQEVSDELGK
ncbi:MAG: DUF4296 domain-containing protein [Bacteroidetes bacterium]|nr:DUF4296 domain-containing protein [Bacteroidota bacterium]